MEIHHIQFKCLISFMSLTSQLIDICEAFRISQSSFFSDKYRITQNVHACKCSSGKSLVNSGVNEKSL